MTYCTLHTISYRKNLLTQVGKPPKSTVLPSTKLATLGIIARANTYRLRIHPKCSSDDLTDKTHGKIRCFLVYPCATVFERLFFC